MTRLLSSLNLAGKFSMLAVIAAVLFLLPFGFYAEHAWSRLHQLRQEQAGLAPSIALLDIVRLTQQHRGLVNAGLSEQRSAIQLKADQLYEALSAQGKAPLPAGPIKQDWSAVASRWSALVQGVGSGTLSRADSMSGHTALIEDELALVLKLAEHHGLAFDEDPRTHHLVAAAFIQLPRLGEAMGRLRALGAAYLTKGQLDPAAQAPIAALVQTARLQRADAWASLLKARQAATGDAALAKASSALEQADSSLAMVEREVLRPLPPQRSAAAYFADLTATIDAGFALQDEAGKLLSAHFQQRMDAQAAVLTAVTAGLVLVALLAIALGILVSRSIAVPIRESVALATRVAEGDLTVQLRPRGTDEMAQLQHALTQMVARLRELLGEVTEGAHSVADTSAQIAQGNIDLSQRTEEQASTLEETASSMEELTSTVAQNAENARRASELANEASGFARKGGDVVQEVVLTMKGISRSSARIEEIIGVIDGIAFQTNILALNAAVEAARAGEQGRGFAVVAGEVRSLAQRSAASAREIKALIAESTRETRSGAELVDSAGQTMAEIVASAEKVQAFIADIAAAGREQSSGIEQVNTAVMQMDQVVQQNASLVEEAAAATESMKQQAASLLRLVSRFRLRAGQTLQVNVPAEQAMRAITGHAWQPEMGARVALGHSAAGASI